jgi:hypothetical protein
MNKEDQYLWSTMRMLTDKVAISKKDLNENYDEILQQLYAEFFIMIYDDIKQKYKELKK